MLTKQHTITCGPYLYGSGAWRVEADCIPDCDKNFAVMVIGHDAENIARFIMDALHGERLREDECCQQLDCSPSGNCS